MTYQGWKETRVIDFTTEVADQSSHLDSLCAVRKLCFDSKLEGLRRIHLPSEAGWTALEELDRGYEYLRRDEDYAYEFNNIGLSGHKEKGVIATTPVYFVGVS